MTIEDENESNYNSIVEIIRTQTPNDVFIDFSFGMKSSLLTWAAHEAGKNIQGCAIVDKSRVFPEVLDAMQDVMKKWAGLGVDLWIEEIECTIKDHNIQRQKELETLVDPKLEQIPLDCVKTYKKHLRGKNKDKFYLLSQLKDHPPYRVKASGNREFTPLVHLTERDIYALRYKLPTKYYIDLRSMNMPHFCANPICPVWKVRRPESLKMFKRWTDSTIKGKHKGARNEKQ